MTARRTSRRREASATPALVRVTEDRYSTHFHGPRDVVHAAIHVVGCPAHWNPRTAAYSVPRRFCDDVCAALETGKPRAVIADRGLF